MCVLPPLDGDANAATREVMCGPLRQGPSDFIVALLLGGANLCCENFESRRLCFIQHDSTLQREVQSSGLRLM